MHALVLEQVCDLVEAPSLRVKTLRARRPDTACPLNKNSHLLQEPRILSRNVGVNIGEWGGSGCVVAIWAITDTITAQVR